MSVHVLAVLLPLLAALGATRRLRVDNSATPSPMYPAAFLDDPHPSNSRILPRIDHAPVVDSLVPVAQSSESVGTPSNHDQLTTAVVIVFVGLCITIAMVFFLVRYFVRRAAIKRRRQASWILRSGQWNMEPKRAHAHETRTGCSDTSSFSAYPYPLSEHF